MTLTPAQRDALAALADGPQRVADADRLRVLYGLRDRGLVEIVIPRDVVLWQLTAEGRKALETDEQR